MTKRPNLSAVDRRTIVKAGAVAGLSQIAAPFVWSARAADTIRVGMVDPLTGVYAAPAQNEVTGAKYAVELINAKGGVLGREIELLVEDSANDVGTGVLKVGDRLRPFLSQKRMVGQSVDVLGPAVRIDSLDGLHDSHMEGTPSVLEQAPVGHLMGKRVLEGVLDIRKELDLVQEFRGPEAPDRGVQLILGDLGNNL